MPFEAPEDVAHQSEANLDKDGPKNLCSGAWTYLQNLGIPARGVQKITL